jgi:hypothetical protein
MYYKDDWEKAKGNLVVFFNEVVPVEFGRRMRLPQNPAGFCTIADGLCCALA